MIYSYPELKGKIKVGDKVRAVKGKSSGCYKLNDDSEEEEITQVDSDGFWIDGCHHSFNNEINHLEIVEEEKERTEITLENLKKNDCIKDPQNNKYKIIERVGDLVFLSWPETEFETCWDTTFGGINHIDELKHDGYKIVPPNQEPRKVTLAQVKERFGEDVVVEG